MGEHPGVVEFTGELLGAVRPRHRIAQASLPQAHPGIGEGEVALGANRLGRREARRSAESSSVPSQRLRVASLSFAQDPLLSHEANLVVGTPTGAPRQPQRRRGLVEPAGQFEDVAECLRDRGVRRR